MKYISVILFCFFTACQPKNESGWIAKYNDEIISTSEIKQMLPEDISQEDSIQFVREYVEKWAKDKILLNESNNILSEEENLDIEQKVAAYREDITEAMIEEHLMHNFTDSVSENEMKTYYDKFPDNFLLKENIISYRMMEVPKDSGRKYKRLLRKDKIDELKSKLKRNNYYADFEENKWIELDKLKSSDILPEKIKKQNLLDKGQIYSTNVNNKSFIIQVTEIGKKGRTAPYFYIKPTIKNVVLNKRKLNLLSQKKNELYDKALQNGDIEIK